MFTAVKHSWESIFTSRLAMCCTCLAAEKTPLIIVVVQHIPYQNSFGKASHAVTLWCTRPHGNTVLPFCVISSVVQPSVAVLVCRFTWIYYIFLSSFDQKSGAGLVSRTIPSSSQRKSPFIHAQTKLPLGRIPTHVFSGEIANWEVYHINTYHTQKIKKGGGGNIHSVIKYSDSRNSQ